MALGKEEQDRRVVGISARATGWLAWSMWALTIALTALSLLLLLVLNLSRPKTPGFDWALGNATVVVEATVGAIVASRRPENPVGWLLCLFGVAVGTSSFASQYAIYALLARPDSLPAGEAMAWIAGWQLPIIIGLQLFYILLFPTGRLPSGRWKWLARPIVAFVVVGVILSAFSSDAYLGSLDPIRNPLGVGGFTPVYTALLYFVFPCLLVAVAFAVLVRLRHAVAAERQQIKWFAYAAAIFALASILNIVAGALDLPPWIERTNAVTFPVAGMLVPIAIGIAILRHRLYDIDIIINRTLVYGSLTLMLALVYFGGVAVTQAVFQSLTGQERQPQLLVVASTLLIAALFTPLRRRIQSFIDRRFYRRKYDARKTLVAYSAKLRSETDLEALSDDLVGAVRETMQPGHVSLWLRPDTAPKGKQAD
jgi:hypothetical protein